MRNISYAIMSLMISDRLALKLLKICATKE